MKWAEMMNRTSWFWGHHHTLIHVYLEPLKALQVDKKMDI